MGVIQQLAIVAMPLCAHQLFRKAPLPAIPPRNLQKIHPHRFSKTISRNAATSELCREPAKPFKTRDLDFGTGPIYQALEKVGGKLTWKFSNPNGIAPSSPGLQKELPREQRIEKSSTPTGLWHAL
jgi:hypothetical protein